MKLDIRYPIGLLFVIIGVILVCCGAVLPPEASSRLLLGMNVNIAWGVVQAAFGVIMLALARAAAKRGRGPGPT